MKIEPVYDSVDLEHLEQILRSRGWEMIRRDLQLALDTARIRLQQTTASDAELRIAQGEVRALLKALQLPEERRKRLQQQEGKKSV